MIPGATELSNAIELSDRLLIVCLEAEELGRKRRQEYLDILKAITKIRLKIQAEHAKSEKNPGSTESS